MERKNCASSSGLDSRRDGKDKDVGWDMMEGRRESASFLEGYDREIRLQGTRFESRCLNV